MPKKKKSKKKSNLFINILIVVLLVIMCVSGYQVFSFMSEQNKENKPAKELETKIVEQSEKDVPQDHGFALSRKAWDDLKAQNPDIVGYMAFPDGFVKEPIVHPPKSDPNRYFRNWIDGSHLSMGTVFVDSNNNMTDQNLMIYGHSVDYDEKAKFSPLTFLVNQDDWEKHHTFTIWYDDHVSVYEIVAVQMYDTEADHGSFVFNQPNFKDQQDFDKYMAYVRQHNVIDSHGDLDSMTLDTKFLTLQTCKRFESRYHVLLTCKQVSDRAWSDSTQ